MRTINTYLAMTAAAIFIIATPNTARPAPTDVSIPPLMEYQARLTDNNGMPIDGNVDIKVYLFDSATEGFSGDLNDGHLLYAENHENVNIARGTLRIAVGQGNPLGAFADSLLPLRKIAEAAEVYLEIEIGGETISPRQRAAFSNSAYAAAYAKSAKSLIGTLNITTGSFPDDFSADKIASDVVDPLRFPSIPAGKLGGTSAHIDTIPWGIPLSKLDTTLNQTLSADRMPNVTAPKVQSGEFASSVIPTAMLSASKITIDAGQVPDGGVVDPGSVNCQCMAALHSTTGGGAEGMNTASVSLNPSGGTVGCTMTFEETGMVKKDDPSCAVYPDAYDDCSGYCSTWCEENCVPNSPANPVCTGPELMECEAGCRSGCNACFENTNVSLPCNASYMCVCID